MRSIGALSAHVVQDRRFYRQGAMVAAVGHSLMGPSAGATPSASIGCISQVIPDKHSGHIGRDMLRTATQHSAVHTLVMDCWVHSGCSGGALVLLVSYGCSALRLALTDFCWQMSVMSLCQGFLLYLEFSVPFCES